jgi:uncharacterized protein YjbJ (UPF0337 family)
MNTSHVEGAFDQAKGKVKQAIGETFNDQSLANEGAADQVKGHAKEAWGSVKDTAHDLGRGERTNSEIRAEEDAHDARNSVTRAAAHAKESIQHGLDSLRNK